MHRFLKTGGLFLGVLALMGAGFYLRPYAENFLPQKQKPLRTASAPFSLGKRTLVIAPHPDDETLGGGGVIEKAIAEGKDVRVVILTSGDGYKRAVMENVKVLKPTAADYRRLGEMRQRESTAAMAHFGVKKENVLFLGYPDGGVNGMWELNWDPDKLHKGLNGAVRSPYAFAYEKNAPYCGANVAKNLSDIIRDYKPTDVLYPDPNDQHHDHWATNAFVKYVLTEQHYLGKEWTYLVHRGDFPFPWMYKPNLPLKPPPALQDVDTNWVQIRMSDQERQRKKEALALYPTQVKVMDPFLLAFVRQNELAGTYTDPVLPVSRKPVDFSRVEEETPYFLFHDPYADTFKRETEPGADLIATGAVLADGRLHLGFEAKAAVSPRVHYALRARILRPGGKWSRLDLFLHEGQLSAQHLAANSLSLPKNAALQVHGNRVWVSLPSSLLDGAESLMMSADSSDGTSHVDKTAWRLMRVQK